MNDQLQLVDLTDMRSALLARESELAEVRTRLAKVQANQAADEEFARRIRLRLDATAKRWRGVAIALSVALVMSILL